MIVLWKYCRIGLLMMMMMKSEKSLPRIPLTALFVWFHCLCFSVFVCHIVLKSHWDFYKNKFCEWVLSLISRVHLHVSVFVMQSCVNVRVHTVCTRTCCKIKDETFWLMLFVTTSETGCGHSHCIHVELICSFIWYPTKNITLHSPQKWL